MGGFSALVAVCDGVGGLSSGEVASGTVIHWLTEWFESDYALHLLRQPGESDDMLLDWVLRSWTDGMSRLNETIRRYGKERGANLGTTVTASLFHGSRTITVHVGDCRVYRFRSGAMEQLTEDQTWVAREVKRGTISPEEARNHPRKNVILQAVGTQSEVYPVFLRDSWQEGDSYVICCDGYRNELFDDEMQNTFSGLDAMDEDAMTAQLAKLAELVMRRGERDNVTAVALSCLSGHDAGVTRIEEPELVETKVEIAEPTGQLLDSDKEESASSSVATETGE